MIREVASALDTAAPFLLTALVTFVSCFMSLLVIKRMKEEYQRNVNEARRILVVQLERLEAKLDKNDRREGGPDPEFPTIELNQETLASTCNWALDGASIFAGVLGPGIGLSLLLDDLGTVAIITYSIVMAATAIGLALFVAKVPVAGYENLGIRFFHFGRWRPSLKSIGPVTPVSAIIVAVNLLVGVGILVLH
ncbi:MAG TPA: hypothetical protein VF731_11130 [Solirubrobacterales bacterium]